MSSGNAARREHHERQLAEARDDYYRESEGPPGTWIGSLADRLGVRGKVTVEQFRRLLDGQHPETGETLSSSAGQRKTVAFDLAFSAPKSVSLLRMAADEPTSKAIDRAHDRAVRAALEYVEREGWKGRELRDGERVVTDGTGVIGVLYRHETTRNADPQLHSHAVLANLVDDGTGRVRAIQSQVLYWQAKTAGTIYQAVLRGELGRDLGIEFDQPVNGLADVQGFDRGLIEDFSTRRAEILAALDRSGLSATSKTAAERVALESRRAKDMGLDHHEWRSDVRATLRGAGLDQERVETFLGGTRAPAVVGGRESGAGESDLEDRIQHAPLDGLTDRSATEDERAVRQAAMNVSGGYGYDEVSDALARVFDDHRLVQVQEGERPRWTTTAHLQLEGDVRSATLERAQETTSPRVTRQNYEVPTRTPDGHPLSSDQRDALAEILTSGRGVELVRARAGAGKTTIAGLARAEFEQHGFKVVGVAPTLQALAELDDVGLQTKETLARCAFDTGEFSEVMRTMDGHTVVLLDEAGMAQTKDVAPLLRRAQERGAKVVAIGDDVQLAAVGAGGWFRYLAEHRDMPVLELTEVHRQRDPVERDHLNQLHRGDVTGWTRWADHHDRIHVTPTVEGAYAETVGRFTTALDELGDQLDPLVVMAPQNAHRKALNDQLRRVVADRGILNLQEERDFGGLRVAPGDRLVATATVAHPTTNERLVENGERFEVLSVGPAGARARAVVGRRRGADVLLPADVLIPAQSGPRIDHAYARTVHKAQATTVNRSILFAPDPAQLGRNLAYVGLTRTRDRADLVTVAPDRASGLERLQRGMTERRDHEAALAFVDRDALDPARIGVMSDRELDEHRHAILTETRQAMARLTRLDRDNRTVWEASGEARTDARLIARHDHLAEDEERTARHLRDHDPAGERQRRGMMEATIARGGSRECREREDVAGELRERAPLLDPAETDAVLAVAQREQHRVARYVDALLEGLKRVHGEQIDRMPNAAPATDIPEHERPAQALREARRRAQRVHDLNGAAAQQLGTGHPRVAQWLRDSRSRTATAPNLDPDRHEVGNGSVRFTPEQQAFADALGRWGSLRREWVEAGGEDQFAELQYLADRLQRHETLLSEAIESRRKHEASKPPRILGRQRDSWETRRGQLDLRVDDAETRLQRVEAERGRLESHLGRPVDEARAKMAGERSTLAEARRAATDAEHRLLAAGPAGYDPRRLRKTLGRRDELPPAQQRAFDDLAGRLAVDDVLGQAPNRGRGGVWHRIGSANTRRDVDRWNECRGRRDAAVGREEPRRDREPTPER